MAYNILIVDDSPTVRAVIKKTLNLASFNIGQIMEAANGQEALNTIDEHDVDFILSDINMPVMSGVEFVDRLKERGELGSTPVIVISTEGSTTRIEELKRKGVSAYVRKPFTPESISNIVNNVMGK
ncbi:MAG: response regulator [Planctomycetota bacterium]